jgi:hypothetical protein
VLSTVERRSHEYDCLDLAVEATHKAVVIDEQGRFITSVFALRTRPSDLEHLLARARQGDQGAA